MKWLVIGRISHGFEKLLSDESGLARLDNPSVSPQKYEALSKMFSLNLPYGPSLHNGK